ncbi:Lysosomal cobalamin transporter ABCD4 [Halotydeus destructor]|nr:Lysosomal cobalamin transporter ABCD4 [Halotydeus destructor]
MSECQYNMSDLLYIPLNGESASSKEEKMSKYKFDFAFLKKFTKLYFRYMTDSNLTGLLFVLLLFICLLEQFFVYRIGLISGDYYKILVGKDLSGFWVQTIKSTVLVVIIAGVKSSREYIASSLYVTWRKILTINIQRLYFSDDNYYDVNTLNQNEATKIDNPDQRITQDVDQMCTYLSQAVPLLVISPFIIVYYSYDSYQTTGLVGPAGCFGYFLLTTGVSKVLMSPIIQNVYAKERAEGNFRFQHLHIRTQSESIAFMFGSRLEEKITMTHFKALIQSMESLILRQFLLGIAVNITSYFGSIVSFLVLAVPLFAGYYDNMEPAELSKLVSTNAFVSIYLINAFTQLVEQSSGISTITGTGLRVCQLIERLESLRSRKQLDLHRKQDDMDTETIPGHEDNFYELNQVTLFEPGTNHNPKQLVNNLSLEIKRGTNIFITGPSGGGKTSILRLLRGLWQQSQGTVHRTVRPGMESSALRTLVLFLPQRPVLACGSLRQQIIYPEEVDHKLVRHGDESEGSRIHHYLRFLDIENLLSRVNDDLDKMVTWDWNDILSPGEMQRLAIARVFYHRPRLAILDEATSAVSMEMEEAIYKELKRLHITVITAGHRETLKKFHQLMVTPSSFGKWTVSQCDL